MGMRLLGPVYLVGGQDYHSTHLDWEANDCNTYLVDTGDGLVLVDCGCGESLETILANIEDMDMEVGELSHLLLTHAHLPHAGGAGALAKMGVEVRCSPTAAEAIQEGDWRTADYHYGKTFPPCAEAAPVRGGDSIEEGRCTFSVVELPGHSPGSVGFEMHAEGRHMLFCGDVVRSPDLQSYRGRPGYDAERYVESLRKLLERPPEVLYPGHGPFCLSRGKVWVQKELRKLLNADGTPMPPGC